jgi:hypothetical protein
MIIEGFWLIGSIYFLAGMFYSFCALFVVYMDCRQPLYNKQQQNIIFPTHTAPTKQTAAAA